MLLRKINKNAISSGGPGVGTPGRIAEYFVMLRMMKWHFLEAISSDL